MVSMVTRLLYETTPGLSFPLYFWGFYFILIFLIAVTNTWEKQFKEGGAYFGPQCESIMLDIKAAPPYSSTGMDLAGMHLLLRLKSKFLSPNELGSRYLLLD